MTWRTPIAYPRIRLFLVAGLTATCLPTTSSAQVIEPRQPVERTELGGRLHFQMNSTSSEGEPASEFMVRRARIWAATRVNDWIDGAVQVDVSGGAAVARFAFVRLTLSPVARISFGQFKRAFDNFELTSSSQILVVERDGEIRGAASCAGIGGICSYSRFSEKLLFSSLDVGMLLQGEVKDGRLAYLVTATNGPGPNTREENDTKSFSARLEWMAMEGVKLGVNGGVHDYPDPARGRDAFATAWAMDVELGDFDEGAHLQGGLMMGRNWRNLDAGGEGSRFLTVQGIVSYRVPFRRTGRIKGVEPVGRLSWGDPDREVASDGGLLVTPGLMLHFEGRNKIALNVDAWRAQAGTTVWGLKAQTYLYF